MAMTPKQELIQAIERLPRARHQVEAECWRYKHDRARFANQTRG